MFQVEEKQKRRSINIHDCNGQGSMNVILSRRSVSRARIISRFIEERKLTLYILTSKTVTMDRPLTMQPSYGITSSPDCAEKQTERSVIQNRYVCGKVMISHLRLRREVIRHGLRIRSVR